MQTIAGPKYECEQETEALGAIRQSVFRLLKIDQISNWRARWPHSSILWE